MLDKNKIENIISIASSMNDSQLNHYSGKLRGLYTAYIINKNYDVLEEITNTLATIFEQLNLNNQNNKATKIFVDYDFAEFYEYLKLKGLSDATVKGYIRALKRILSKYDYDSLKELAEDIEKVTQDYANGKDMKYHNIHLSALNRLYDFMQIVSETKCYYVMYKENDDTIVLQETFNITSEGAWKKFKLLLDFIRKIKQRGCTLEGVYFSDKITQVKIDFLKRI